MDFNLLGNARYMACGVGRARQGLYLKLAEMWVGKLHPLAGLCGLQPRESGAPALGSPAVGPHLPDCQAIHLQTHVHRCELCTIHMIHNMEPCHPEGFTGPQKLTDAVVHG